MRIRNQAIRHKARAVLRRNTRKQHPDQQPMQQLEQSHAV